MDLASFIGKKNEELEKEFGFTHYIELKDSLQLGHECEDFENISAVVKLA